MRLKFENIKENSAMLMRKAGYIFQHKEGAKMSFIKPLARSGYPRFHAYVEVDGANLILNLHLDQKKVTYGIATRHHGEYEDSDLVKNEAERIKKITNPQLT